MFIEESPLQPENAELPMPVTELGIVTEVMHDAPEKVLVFISVTVLGITKSATRLLFIYRLCA